MSRGHTSKHPVMTHEPAWACSLGFRLFTADKGKALNLKSGNTVEHLTICGFKSMLAETHP